VRGPLFAVGILDILRFASLATGVENDDIGGLPTSASNIGDAAVSVNFDALLQDDTTPSDS
jgi:hypothetical protein